MSDSAYPTCMPGPDGHCSICGDEATMARVAAIDREGGTAEVITETIRTTVALDLVEDVHVGDSLLVHMGFAIGRVGGAEGA